MSTGGSRNTTGLPPDWVKAGERLRQQLDNSLSAPNTGAQVRRTGRRVAVVLLVLFAVFVSAVGAAIYQIGAHRHERKEEFRARMCALDPAACGRTN